MRHLYALVGALLLAFSAYGQVDREERGLSLSVDNLRVGVKGGVNRATTSGDFNNIGTAIRARAGIFAEVSLLDNLYLQPELSYSRKQVEGQTEGELQSLGGNPVPPGFDNVNTITLNENSALDYLSLTAMVKYTLLQAGSFRISAMAGPYLSYLAGQQTDGDAQAEIQLPDPVGTLRSTDNSTDTDYQAIDYGGRGGLALAYAVGPGTITLHVSASMGIPDIYNKSTVNSTFSGFDVDGSQFQFNQQTDVGKDVTVKNRVLPAVTVGYIYGL
jgi:hypothetical protein